MKFLLSFFLWVFGVEAPVEVTTNIQPRQQKVQHIDQSTDDGSRSVILNDRDKRFGGHIIIFEDTHFRKRKW